MKKIRKRYVNFTNIGLSKNQIYLYFVQHDIEVYIDSFSRGTFMKKDKKKIIF